MGFNVSLIMSSFEGGGDKFSNAVVTGSTLLQFKDIHSNFDGIHCNEFYITMSKIFKILKLASNAKCCLLNFKIHLSM